MSTSSVRARANNSPSTHTCELVSENNAISSVGLVDSGSTVTFIPFELAEVLEVPHIKENVKSIGAGGTFDTFITKLRHLQLIKASTIFSDFVNLPVHVPTEPDRIPYVILGRDSIFTRFEVTFRERSRRMILYHRRWAARARAQQRKRHQ